MYQGLEAGHCVALHIKWHFEIGAGIHRGELFVNLLVHLIAMALRFKNDVRKYNRFVGLKLAHLFEAESVLHVVVGDAFVVAESPVLHPRLVAHLGHLLVSANILLLNWNYESVYIMSHLSLLVSL